MRKYNKKDILAAFSTFARCADNGVPVCQKDLGLNPRAAAVFVAAVTHTWRMEKHGVELHRIFIPSSEERFLYKRNTTPNNNPKDASLIDRVIDAMVVVGRIKRDQKSEPAQPKVIINPLEKFSTAELLAEIARRIDR